MKKRDRDYAGEARAARHEASLPRPSCLKCGVVPRIEQGSDGKLIFVCRCISFRPTFVEVGTRLKATHDWPYRDANGTGTHHLITEVEVTKIENGLAYYKTVSVIEESGRPSWNPDPFVVGEDGTSGGFAIKYYASGDNSGFELLKP